MTQLPPPEAWGCHGSDRASLRSWNINQLGSVLSNILQTLGTASCLPPPGTLLLLAGAGPIPPCAGQWMLKCTVPHRYCTASGTVCPRDPQHSPQHQMFCKVLGLPGAPFWELWGWKLLDKPRSS